MPRHWTKEQLDSRTRKVKRKYGANAYKQWGAQGGNPLLLEYRKNKRKE